MSAASRLVTAGDAYRQSADFSQPYVEQNDNGWGTYNSGITGPDGYDETFADVLGGKSIIDIAKPLPGRPFVAVDLMATTTALQELFDQLPPDIEKRGVAVCLGDNRSEELRDRNERSGITQLSGNLALGATWRQLEDELGGKANLILERSDLGVACLPRNSLYYGAAFNRTWGLLAMDGTALIQPPSPAALSQAGTSVDILADTLQSQHVLTVADSNALRVIKSPWNPDRLDLR